MIKFSPGVNGDVVVCSTQSLRLRVYALYIQNILERRLLKAGSIQKIDGNFVCFFWRTVLIP